MTLNDAKEVLRKLRTCEIERCRQFCRQYTACLECPYRTGADEVVRATATVLKELEGLEEHDAGEDE